MPCPYKSMGVWLKIFWQRGSYIWYIHCFVGVKDILAIENNINYAVCLNLVYPRWHRDTVSKIFWEKQTTLIMPCPYSRHFLLNIIFPMAYNRKKHHRRSIRLPGYDYTQPGAYYITICTYERQCWFGDIDNGKMQKNYLGYIAHIFWQALPRRFPHIELDVFVVMPNHLHGILIITDEGYQALPKNRPRKEQFGKPVPGSIPTVVRSFKSAVTRRINLMRRTKTPPIWQGNYYESIVRVETGLDAIRQYIINNPLQWEIDKENIKYHSNEILDLGLDF